MRSLLFLGFSLLAGCAEGSCVLCLEAGDGEVSCHCQETDSFGCQAWEDSHDGVWVSSEADFVEGGTCDGGVDDSG